MVTSLNVGQSCHDYGKDITIMYTIYDHRYGHEKECENTLVACGNKRAANDISY